ncbi:peptidylprolyl isomerase [Kushneria phosphatilytica]|uniref:Peptidyl-prolyl cis-trans isomerase n=1 Tax=Kushneria phosphatilytica TaxID=657387 RepID=A0A1S1NRF7_9GAMM|nr:peptidylprolyl isomerase [Kushneria phosphatilytica]OHV11844.1 peptidylprolyl isomerase [Kushneria phosphatilytica]QEL11016.1 peptidyl-prolyl cis-trans isomerase [Kushneria phosphatilytica]
MIVFNTSAGDITVELFHEQAPETTANFERYVRDGHFDNTLFHRVIDGFMVQGGGFTTDFEQKPTRAPIRNEATNGLKNTRGRLAMARTNDPHSATAQFFINVADNSFLDHSAPTPQGWGYCVFGEVREGMDVVDNIRKVATTRRGMHADVPSEDIIVHRAWIADS